MSLHKQFEGPDVQALLSEIRREYGYDPTITRAETYRAGGVLGFFAREQYRLVVDESPAGEKTAALPSAADRAVSGPDYSLSANRASLASFDEAPIDASARRSADPFADLADEMVDSNMVIGDRPAVAAPSERELHPSNSQQPNFDTVLERVATMIDVPSHPDYPALRDVAVTIPDSLAGLDDLSGRHFSETKEPSSLDDGQGQPSPAPAGPADSVEPPDSAPPADNTAAYELVDGRSSEDYEDYVDYEEVVDDEYAYIDESDELGQGLLRCGLDHQFVSYVLAEVRRGRDIARALVDGFCQLPDPPQLPRTRGSLIAVIGPAARARAEAKEIAADVGSDPAAIYFATSGSTRGSSEERRIRSADEAVDVVPGVRRRKIEVVAIDVPVGSSDYVWARHVLKALQPTLVLAVVDATLKTEDIGAWVESIGEVDGLVVDNPGTTVSPADILRLKLPICRLGSGPANPARWAATILDRVMLPGG